MIKVFVVDDEKPILNWISSLIRKMSTCYSLCGAASNGRDALEQIIKCRPELVLSDVCMPVADGLMLLDMIKRENLDTEFVVLSNYDDFKYVHTALVNGAFDYMLKSELTEAGLAKLHDKLIESRFGSIADRIKSTRQNSFIIKLMDTPVIPLSEIGFLVQKYGVSLQDEALACIIMLIPAESSADIWLMEHKEIFSHEAISNINFYTLEKPNRLVLLFNIIHTSALNQYNKYNEFINSLFSYFGCSIGASEFCIGYRHLQDSVKHSVFVLQRAYTDIEKSKPAVYRYSDDVSYIYDEQKEHIYDIAGKIEQSVNAGLYEEVSAALDDFMESAGELWVYDRVYVGMLISRILYCFLAASALKPQKETFHSIDHYKSILNSDDFETARKTVYAVFSGLHESRNMSQAVILVIGYVKEHYAAITSMQEIADSYNYNVDYLYRIFKKEVGISFVSYLTRLRMLRAAEFLSATDESVAAIAENVGYANTDYFTKKFRETYGCTPSAYRIKWKKHVR